MTEADAPAGALAVALRELSAVARGAGQDPAAARAEGVRLAAAVAERSPGAFAEWAAQTGEPEGAAAFADAARHGRAWRGAPTSLLDTLIASGSPGADAYARALAGVATAAATLGTPDARATGNAAAAASAQLSAVAAARRLHAARPEGSPRAAGPTADHDFVARAPALVEQVLARLGGQRPSPAAPGSWLDLDATAPIGPGAFDLTGRGSPAAGPRPTADPDTTSEPGTAVEPGTATGDPRPEPAADTAAQAATEAEPAEDPRTLPELLAELDELIGLADVKAEIHRQAALLRVEGLRRDAGLDRPAITRHLVFVGNPGTGKTTVARLVAGIYRALGLLSKGHLVEVDRSDLVAGYLGQTATKTADVVASAAGGVLFIDEAYSLTGDQYSTEAVDTLVKEMEDRRDDLVVIVAGYPGPMALFVAQNPGLASRFRTTVEFADYSDEELVEIFTLLAEAADYDLAPQTIAAFAELAAAQERGPAFGNARYARNCLEAAIGAHAWRLRDVEQPSLEQLRELRPEDLTEPDPDRRQDEA